jgi:hypothetical protein
MIYDDYIYRIVNRITVLCIMYYNYKKEVPHQHADTILLSYTNTSTRLEY